MAYAGPKAVEDGSDKKPTRESIERRRMIISRTSANAAALIPRLMRKEVWQKGVYEQPCRLVNNQLIEHARSRKSASALRPEYREEFW